MTTLREAWARLTAFVRRNALDRDFDEELAAHVEMAAEEYVRQGVSPAEARRRALARLGGVESSKQLHRETRGLPSLDALLLDARYAIRTLRRSPGFTLMAVATLAVGIGVNAAVFTVANAVLFKGFRSVDGNDRLLYIGTHKDARGCCVSYPDFVDWREGIQSFEDLGAVADLRIALADATGSPESYTATLVSANTFRLLGQHPIVGRDFTPADERPGAAPVAILSHGFWERRYGSDRAVVGRTVRINGAPATVIGVMPQGFSFPQDQELWMPLVPTPDRQKRDARGLWFAFGRMAQGATFESARSELETIGGRLARAYPQTNEGWVPQPQTFTEFFVDRDAATTYGALWGAVGFVLLIACANLAHLTLARALERGREISVRLALGAGRCRVATQLLVEGLLLSSAAGVAGWWLALIGVRTYRLIATAPTQAWAEGLLDFSLDGRVLVYLIAISLAAGVLSSLAPILRLTRMDLNSTLKDGGRGSAGSLRGRRLSALVVTTEMAVAVVLVSGAGVMIRSFVNIYTASPGFDAGEVVTMLVNLPQEDYRSSSSQIAFFERVVVELGATPGVQSVALGSSGIDTGAMTPYEVAGTLLAEDERLSAAMSRVGPGYFGTLGTKVLAGREFDASDGSPARPAAIVNERMARASWPDEDPIGKQVRLFDGAAPGVWLTVVGVVSNIQWDVSRGRDRHEPRVYVPYRQRPAGGAWLFARTQLPVSSIASALRHEIQALDPNVPVWLGPYTLAERLTGSGAYWSIGSHAALFSIFALIALLLASVGLYAVIAHSVSQRTQEIGVRMAVGGTTRDILALILRQGMAPLGIGLAIGLAASVALTRLLKAELVDVSPIDPMALTAAAAVLVAAALVGCLIPARRAMRVDPVVALRHE
jgi:putative ABC transport system permease protein